MIPTATDGGTHTTTRRLCRNLPSARATAPLRSKKRSMIFSLPVPHGRTMACCKPKKRWNLRAAMPKRSSSSLPMASLTMTTGLTMALLPMRLKRLNPSRMRVPWFTRSAFSTVLTRTPMSTLTKLQKQTSICRRSPATTPLPLTRNPKEPGAGTSATDLTMQITIWQLPALMG